MLDKSIKQLRDTALEVVWIQWSAVGAMASSRRQAKSIVDPEGLLLMTLSLLPYERRLEELALWWGAEGARLLSVQRAKNIARAFPQSTQVELGRFARAAIEHGGDPRWRSIDRGEAPAVGRKKRSPPESARFADPAAVMLRLRLGIGVGAKADILGLLIGLEGAWVTVRSLSFGLGYTDRAIRRAADELAGAGLISRSESPVEYRIREGEWSRLLSLTSVPTWHHWYRVFSFVAQILEQAERLTDSSVTSYVQSSRARDFAEQHSEIWKALRIPPPRLEAHKGSSFLGEYSEAIERVSKWMIESV